jgi:hypothetical protein
MEGAPDATSDLQGRSLVNLGARELMLIVGLMGVLLLPTIFYVLTLQRALGACSPQNRQMEPGMVWLMLVPLVNIVWHFIVVSRVSGAMALEFAQRGIPTNDPTVGRQVGLATCILNACSIIPYVGILASIAGLVCWIIYWMKIAEATRGLQPAAAI